MSRVEDAVNCRTKPLLLGAFGASLALHGVAYASLIGHPSDPPAPSSLVSTVSFEVTAMTPPEPRTPKLPDTSGSVTPERAQAPNSKPAARTAIASPAPAARQVASPALDLSGVTLTNEAESGFSMPVGDGSALHGPIGLGGAHADIANAAAARPAVTTASPALVAARDLSEHPRPPALEGLLRANYPDEAKRRGLAGTASVRARIDADGVVRSARVVGESTAGFASACRRTVLGSRWSAPRAQNGDAVATEIVYTCHFEVD
jgi:TonB family protein